jgi:RNA-directed DNA polymerase
VRDRLNALLRGWSAYFSYGTLTPAHRAVDGYVCARVQHFLARRHKLPGHGVGRFPWRRVFGELGVHRLRGPAYPVDPPWASP